jgi:hypothetical protein
MQILLFFLSLILIYQVIKIVGKRNTKLAAQELQYDIMKLNIEGIIKARPVNETSYNEISGYFSTLAKLPHKNKEKSQVLYREFWMKYESVIDQINERREKEEREIKSHHEFDPDEVFMEIDDCRKAN